MQIIVINNSIIFYMFQKLVNTVNKHKSDLKHTFEMQRLEQTELDNLKSQHAQKLSELEKTQRELLDVSTCHHLIQNLYSCHCLLPLPA